MNKLTISEGGQPVYLDDLILLQDNAHGMMSHLLKLLTGANAFLETEVSRWVISSEGGVDTVEYGAATLYFDGFRYEIPKSQIQIVDNAEVYICLRHQPADVREFEDLQSRPCREVLEGYYSTVPTGSYRSFWMSKLKTFRELLKDPLVDNDWKNVAVTFNNGYTGTLRYKPASTGTYDYHLEVHSNQEEWLTSSIYTDCGLVGQIKTEGVGQHSVILDKRTATFSMNGGSYYLRFAKSGAILLYDALNVGQLPAFVKDITYSWNPTSMVVINEA